MGLIPIKRDEHDFELSRKCSFCESPSTAYWTMANTVEVCSACALDILPALIADAAVGHMKHADRAREAAERGLDRLTATYWKAVTSAIARAVRPEPQPAPEDDEDA